MFENLISTIVNENHAAYRFISKSGGLASDILEYTNYLGTEGFLMAVDIEKTFDSINHSFLLYLNNWILK